MISLENISHSYCGKTIFSDYTLHIEKGEKVLLFSQSGTGKTTLMKMILGFVTPDKGKITVDDLPLSRSTVRAVRRKISYISQGIDFEKITIRQLIEEISLLSEDFNMNMFKEYSELFNIHSWDKEAGLLSGGEKQRLGLSIGLALCRPILLLDEITSGLDDELKLKVKDIVLKQDKTSLIISHDSVWRDDKRLRKETFANGSN